MRPPQGAGICGAGQMFSSVKRKVGGALDMVVVTPEDIERFGDSPALIIEPALREGKVVYAASL